MSVRTGIRMTMSMMMTTVIRKVIRIMKRMTRMVTNMRLSVRMRIKLRSMRMSTGWDRDDECEDEDRNDYEDADLDEHPNGDDSAFLDIRGMRIMMAVTIRITIKIMMKSRMNRRRKNACVLNHRKITPIPCELRMGFVPKINFPSDLSSRKLHRETTVLQPR